MQKNYFIFGLVTGEKRCWRQLIIALALAAATFAARAQSCDPAPSGIVSWWAGESNALDNVGTNNGIAVNNPTYVSGKVGPAFHFNGNQWIRVPDSPGLRFTGAMTVAAWVNPAAISGSADSGILIKYGGFTAGQSAYSFYIHTDRTCHIQLTTDGSSPAANVGTTHICPTNTWTHLAATYDGSTLSIYFNGNLEASTPFSGSIFPGTYDLGIGAALGGGGTNQGVAAFNGLIDEPTVYNRALSSGEIQAIYNADLSGVCPIPPSVAVQPTDQTVPATSNPVLSALFTGSQPMALQWYFNGTNIPGATSATLTLTNVSLSQSGNYYLAASNAAGGPVSSSSAALTVVPPPSCDPAPSGIISWWSGEGNALDNLNLNPGNFVNGPSYAPGFRGLAFNFDGSSQYVVVTNSPSLTPSNALSLAAWIYPTALNPQSSAILCKYAAPGNFGASSWSFSLETDGTGVMLANTSGGSAVIHSVSVCPFNAWTHLTTTYDGTNLSIYFNGSLETSAPLSGSITPSTYNLGIGANVGGGAAALFSGMIDEPAIYNRALSSGEISAIYSAGISGLCPLPVTIVTQPTNQTISAQSTATLTAAVAGSQPISLQWYFNGTNIAGATTASLTLTNLTVNQSGTYYLAASNAAGGPVFSSNAVLTIVPPPPCDPAPSGIVSWWSGQANALDNSGGNNGTLIGAPTFTNGEVGQAFNFNGTSQYVRVPDAPNLRFTNAMTAEAWVFPRSYNSASSSILVKFDAVQNINQRAWSFGLTGSGGLGFLTLSPDGLNGGGITTTNAAPLNTWTHLAATYDGAKIMIYLNGVVQASTPYTNNIFPGTDALGIGANIGGGGPVALFNGLIDEPAVYSRALSSNEITAIYNAGISGKCATSFPPFASIVPSVARINPGATANFDAFISGSPTLSYQWKLNGSTISNATNRAFSVGNVSMTNIGTYTLQVSNGPASVFSTNAQLELLLVSVLGNNVLLTNSQYTFTNSVTIKLTNYYTNGDIFYTLDGSTPTPESAFYTSPFVLTNNSTIRTLGYSPDFQQYATSDPIGIIFPAVYTLSATTPGGGSIASNPSATNYLANTFVTLTATPSNGWRFLQWTGDIGGPNPTNAVLMDRNKSVQAIFGTSVSNIAGGNGSIVFNPSGGVYPFGTVLQASAVPQSGNFFVLWGDNASGNVNPLAFSVTNANQTISALFYTLDPGEVALAVVPVGPGTVSINPQANTYTVGAQVTLTATPAPGKNFLGWSGNASGTNNPLNVTLNQSETIYANFTTNATLVVYPVTTPGTGDGVAIDLNGQTGSHYRLDASRDLVNWTNLYNVTNYTGLLHYVDSTATNLPFRYYRGQLVVP